MIRRETSFILLLVSITSVACNGEHYPGKPDLPQSIPPAWTLKGFQDSAMLTTQPPGLPAGVPAQCGKALYAGGQEGLAEVWICGYTQEGSAFNALQRTPAEANTVKLQEGRRLALVKWNGTSREEVKALVVAIQKALRKSDH
ncbi:MAG: hypothetical protein ABJC09_11710 [Terriglobia bacterium]